MFSVVYGVRDKKTNKLLHLDFTDDSFVDDDHYAHDDKVYELTHWSEFGIFTTENLHDVLFSMYGIRVSNSNSPFITVDKKNLEVVSIISVGDLQVITSDNTPQSLLDYFESDDEIFKMASMTAGVFYEDYYNRFKNKSKEKNGVVMDAWELGKAWLALSNKKDVSHSLSIEFVISKIEDELNKIKNKK